LETDPHLNFGGRRWLPQVLPSLLLQSRPASPAVLSIREPLRIRPKSRRHVLRYPPSTAPRAPRLMHRVRLLWICPFHEGCLAVTRTVETKSQARKDGPRCSRSSRRSGAATLAEAAGTNQGSRFGMSPSSPFVDGVRGVWVVVTRSPRGRMSPERRLLARGEGCRGALSMRARTCLSRVSTTATPTQRGRRGNRTTMRRVGLRDEATAASHERLVEQLDPHTRPVAPSTWASTSLRAIAY
jgi:hypothetical protein